MADAPQDDLERLKFNISTSWTYNRLNVDRFNTFRHYVFNTTINDDQQSVLQSLGKPVIEFNQLEAYLSRWLGEFAMQEPSIEVSPADEVQIDMRLVELIKGYLRHIFYKANQDGMSYEAYKESITGGFSVLKCWVEYANPMSMKKVIRVGKVFDSTMVGFDPLARAPHKGDGEYSFEVFPMRKEEFEREYPNADIKGVSFGTNLEEFQWGFKDNKGVKTIMVCDYYEKTRKRIQIVEVATGETIPKRAYEKFVENWTLSGRIEQPPAIIGKPRWTEITKIVRYKLIQNQILSKEVTDYEYLPHVFMDCNSVLLRESQSNITYQMTRPAIYQAKGQQDLINFAGQSLANYFENMVQHKFIVMKEALPQEEDYLNALTDIQKMNTIVVNAFNENNPDQPINTPIREVQMMPPPPELMQTYANGGAVIQSILGSYASNLGKNDNDLSGKAVIESMSVGNAAAMPQVVGYLQAITQLATIVVSLLPKYIKGLRQLPMRMRDDSTQMATVNAPGNPYLDYQPNALNVHIDAGVNFQVQKNQALQQITALMSASQEFNELMNSPSGLPILVKNLTCYGADELKEAVPQFLQSKAQQQQQAMQAQQQAMMQNPAMIRAQAEVMKTQAGVQQKQVETQIEVAKLAIEDKKADAELMEARAKIDSMQLDSVIKIKEADTSLERHALDAAAKMAEIESRKHNDHLKTVETHHKIRGNHEEISD